MKKVLLLTLAIMVCASMAFAQAGAIGIYADNPGFVVCDYMDTAAALVPVYFVHKLCPGATASQFMVLPGGGFNCTYTGEVIHVPTAIGNLQAGLSAAYGGCLASDILIATMNWFCMGASPVCASLTVVADPAAPTGTIEVVDCAFAKHTGQGSNFYMNPDVTCACGIITPTQETSWGQIKSIYND